MFPLLAAQITAVGAELASGQWEGEERVVNKMWSCLCLSPSTTKTNTTWHTVLFFGVFFFIDNPGHAAFSASLWGTPFLSSSPDLLPHFLVEQTQAKSVALQLTGPVEPVFPALLTLPHHTRELCAFFVVVLRQRQVWEPRRVELALCGDSLGATLGVYCQHPLGRGWFALRGTSLRALLRRLHVLNPWKRSRWVIALYLLKSNRIGCVCSISQK